MDKVRGGAGAPSHHADDQQPSGAARRSGFSRDNYRPIRVKKDGTVVRRSHVPMSAYGSTAGSNSSRLLSVQQQNVSDAVRINAVKHSVVNVNRGEQKANSGGSANSSVGTTVKQHDSEIDTPKNLYKGDYVADFYDESLFGMTYMPTSAEEIANDPNYIYNGPGRFIFLEDDNNEGKFKPKVVFTDANRHKKADGSKVHTILKKTSDNTLKSKNTLESKLKSAFSTVKLSKQPKSLTPSKLEEKFMRSEQEKRSKEAPKSAAKKRVGFDDDKTSVVLIPNRREKDDDTLV